MAEQGGGERGEFRAGPPPQAGWERRNLCFQPCWKGDTKTEIQLSRDWSRMTIELATCFYCLLTGIPHSYADVKPLPVPHSSFPINNTLGKKQTLRKLPVYNDLKKMGCQKQCETLGRILNWFQKYTVILMPKMLKCLSCQVIWSEE